MDYLGLDLDGRVVATIDAQDAETATAEAERLGLEVVQIEGHILAVVRSSTS